MVRSLFQRVWRRFVPPPLPHHPPALAKPQTPSVPLQRVFPPLPARDRLLAAEQPITEDDITQALDLLRGGQNKGAIRKVTRPARFQIAIRQIKGFAEECLLVHAASRVPIADMYAGYLLWAADHRLTPILRSDFDFAMADHLANFGGIRTERGYQGCRFRPIFLRRLGEVNRSEAKRRLGMSLEELMAGKRPDASTSH